MSRYLDPTTDFAFKYLFGSEANKDLLLSLLNELFQGRKHIVDLFYERTEQVGEYQENGDALFDLICTDTNGDQYIIEVQRRPHENLKERMLFYSGRLLSRQAPRGKRAHWKYAISGVYLILLMDGFSLPADNSNYSSPNCMHFISLSDEYTGQVFYKRYGFIYIELAKFVKEEADLQNDLDRWLFVLKNMASLKKLPVYLRRPIFTKLFDLAEYGRLSREARNMYDRSLKRKWDEYSIRETAKAELKRGIQKGVEEGREQGREQGLKQGRAEVLEEVRAEKLLAAARFKKLGVSNEDIASILGLPIELIASL